MTFDRREEATPPGRGNTTEAQRLWRLYGWVWRLASTVLAVGWMGVIFYLSSLSPADLPQQLEALSWLGKLRDVAGHLLLYGVLGPLLLVSLWSWVAGATYQTRWALVATGFGILYGILDEYHQSFVPGRSVAAFDVFIDSVGVVAGVASIQHMVVVVRRRVAQS